MYVLRPYQNDAVNAAVDFFKTKDKKNAIEVLPTGSGKSLVLANIVKKLGEPTLILQPTKEILEQNTDKLISYGFNPSIYSASLKKKEISEITLATIGSIVNKPELFHQFKHMLIDECDTVNPKGGMYEKFINSSNFKILGVTATPYRLSTDGYGGSMLKFITRTRPKIFDQMIYYVHNKELFDAGYLAKLQYYSIPGFDSSKLKANSTGADYDETSIRNYYTQINFPASIVKVVSSLMGVRKNILVFTRFISEAEFLVRTVPGIVIVTAETPKKDRERILSEFKSGIIKVIANVGILTVGFDYPELETVVIARPTMSLRLWYQMIGRSSRPHISKKESYVVDMGDNLRLFGRVEDMVIENEGGNKWFISSNGKKLTNQYYER